MLEYYESVYGIGTLSAHLLSTVLGWSFWNFREVLIMVWEYACAFYRRLGLFFHFFFHILTWTFFMLQYYGSV